MAMGRKKARLSLPRIAVGSNEGARGGMGSISMPGRFRLRVSPKRREREAS
jgi:hypothetical protein